MSRSMHGSLAEAVLRLRILPLLGLLPVAVATSGCGARARALDAPSRCLLRVTTPEGVPVPGVSVELDGRERTTSGDGEVELTLTGREGERREAKIRCPDDYASPPPTPVTLQKGTAGQPLFRYEASCVPLRHSVVLVVRAIHGPHLPVYRLGRQVALTNDDGIAHTLLSVPAGESLRVTLDPWSLRHVEQDVVTFDFPAVSRDELWAVEHRFEAPPPELKRPALRRNTPARPKRL